MAGLQPPARSWFRLASIARMEAAEAAAAASTARSTTTPTSPPIPRTPPIPRPQQQPTSSPPSPPPLQQPPTPPPPPTLLPPPPPAPPAPQAEPQPELPFTPTPQPEIKAQIATEAASPTPPSPYEPQQPQQMPYEPQQPPTRPRVATPPESPKAIKPSLSFPPHSPTVKQANNPHNPEPEPETKPPPPPLYQTFSTLPEEKTITNSNGSRVSNVSYSKQQGPPTKEDKKLRVITMAGENTGAVMDIGSAAPHRLGHLFHKSDGNGHGRKMEQEHEDSKKGGKGAAKTKHMEAVVNSNVQGINNSIVLNSTTTQHSPGVHITFASNRKPKGSGSSSSHKAHHSDQLH